MAQVAEAVSETPILPKENFTVLELIDALGGPTATARICGFTENTHARGGDMRRRQSISYDHWLAVVEAAQKLGFEQVTIESLFQAHLKKPKTKSKIKPKPARRKKKSSLV